MNYFLNISNRKYIEKNLDITKPCYSKDILIAVPWPFITSRLHGIRDEHYDPRMMTAATISFKM